MKNCLPIIPSPPSTLTVRSLAGFKRPCQLFIGRQRIEAAAGSLKNREDAANPLLSSDPG